MFGSSCRLTLVAALCFLPASAPAALQAPALAVCKEAVIEDNPMWTLITLRFTGDPQLESRPWKASRRLELTVKEAHLPVYNQAFQSSGKLVSEVGLEQLTNNEVRLIMKVAAGTDVTVYKRRMLAGNTTEYAVLFEVPPDPSLGNGPLGWPVRGRLSSKYGWRLHPILHRHRMHTGIDIAVPEGTPIHAAGAGRVAYSASNGGAGLCVIIEHGGGRRSSYAHCSKLKVKAGQTVKKNQLLALAGSTGLSTGPHVHFSVTQDGKQVDPLRLLGGMAQASRTKADKKPAKRKKKPEHDHDHTHD